MTLLQSQRSQRVALAVIWVLVTTKLIAAIFVDLVPAEYLTLAVRIVVALGVLGMSIAKLLPREVQIKHGGIIRGAIATKPIPPIKDRK